MCGCSPLTAFVRRNNRAWTSIFFHCSHWHEIRSAGWRAKPEGGLESQKLNVHACVHTKRQIGSHSLLGCVPFFPSDWKSGNITSGPVLRRRIRSTQRLNEMTGTCTLNSSSWQRSCSSRNVKVPVVNEGKAGQGVFPGRAKRPNQQNHFILNQNSHFTPRVGPEACFIEPGWTMITSSNRIFVQDAFITPGILKQNLLIIVLTPFCEWAVQLNHVIVVIWGQFIGFPRVHSSSVFLISL